MRIAMVTSDRQPGGIAVAVANYADAIVQLGHRLVMVLPHPAHALRDRLSGLGDRLEIATLSPFDAFAARHLGALAPALRNALRGSDVVIAHNNFLCRPLARAGLPLIAVCHSDKWRGLENADRVLCLSCRAVEAAAAAGLGRDRLCLLPHYYEPKAADNVYLGRARTPFVAAAAGRLVAKKGFGDFIRAAALVHRREPDIRFRLAGEGEQRRHLERLASGLGAPVEFAGWARISELAAQAQLFCLTSEREPFGYVLCEMMDYGVPCIATATNGPSDILGDGAGRFYPAGDADALAEHVLALHASDTLRLDLSRRAFTRIRDPVFSRACFTERLAEVLAAAAR